MLTGSETHTQTHTQTWSVTDVVWAWDTCLPSSNSGGERAEGITDIHNVNSPCEWKWLHYSVGVFMDVVHGLRGGGRYVEYSLKMTLKQHMAITEKQICNRILEKDKELCAVIRSLLSRAFNVLSEHVSSKCSSFSCHCPWARHWSQSWSWSVRCCAVAPVTLDLKKKKNVLVFNPCVLCYVSQVSTAYWKTGALLWRVEPFIPSVFVHCCQTVVLVLLDEQVCVFILLLFFRLIFFWICTWIFNLWMYSIFYIFYFILVD